MRAGARTIAVALAAAAAVAAPATLRAQPDVRPTAEWRTIETSHFVVHYPAEMATWTEPMVRRIEAIHGAVTAAIGHEPRRRTTVIVDDPSNQPNGVSFGPVIYLWPTPPDPSSPIGENRGWSELLAVHEFAHSAHLTRPTRNPRDRLLYGLLPFPVEPIAVRSPRWVREGYATYLEGRLTGSGRPYGAWRPAVLRKWALAGRLPAYDALDRGNGYWEGSMAYLLGSAYLEWLVARSGEQSLPDLWARMTSRHRRSFDEAFAGVFGGPPAELYGEFTVDLTGKALETRRALAAAGLVEGERFQRLDGFADDPAVAPDGSRLALTLLPDDRPSRIVIWSTEPDTAAARRDHEARERRLAADPEDVPAVQWRPRPREPLAVLGPIGGRGHRAPRFLPDGERLLVVRSEGLGDGRARPDLFEWTWRTGALRRITHGAGIRSADPAPDGRTAVGTRCLNGLCDVVRIDLESGDVSLVAAGDPAEPYYRPRVSPDGRRAAVGVQRDGVWRIALVELASGEVALVGPDDGASRFDAAWLPDGDALVAVSDAGGVHDLERIDLGDGSARPLTRVVGAALAPAVDRAGGAIWFLTLESRRNDVRRIDAGRAPLERVVTIDPGLAPAAPPRAPDPAPFAEAPIPPSRPYGFGPRGYTLLPQGSIGPGGVGGGLALVGADPLGRLIWTLEGLVATNGGWRGAAASAAIRRWRPEVRATAFAVRHEPSEQDDVKPAGLDADYAGAALGLAIERDFLSRIERFAVGGSAGLLEAAGEPDGTRALGYAEASLSALATPGRWRLTGAFAATGAAGSTAGESWTRGTAALAVGAGRGGLALGAETRAGWTGGDAPVWETFVAGGVRSPLVDPSLLSQRLPLPAVPLGYVGGERIWTVRLAAGSRGITPFWWAGTAGEDLGDWKRALGLEWVLDQDPVPYLGIPESRFEAGVARVLDEPLRHEIRAWLSVSFRP